MTIWHDMTWQHIYWFVRSYRILSNWNELISTFLFKVAEEILERQRLEEEERVKLKQEAEEARLRNAEVQKKALLEDKKRNILQTFQSQKPPEPPLNTERPKKKLISNPLTKRFEEMAALNAKKDEECGQLLQRKKKVRKSRNALHRSKQLLKKVSQESVKKSQTLLKKIKFKYQVNEFPNHSRK